MANNLFLVCLFKPGVHVPVGHFQWHTHDGAKEVHCSEPTPDFVWDVLRSGHCLFFRKKRLASIFQHPLLNWDTVYYAPLPLDWLAGWWDPVQTEA
jgi:hypothetical protein